MDEHGRMTSVLLRGGEHAGTERKSSKVHEAESVDR